MNNNKKIILKYSSIYLSICVPLSIFVTYFVYHEQNIYSWDYANYFWKWQKFSTDVLFHPVKQILRLISSVWIKDYNYLPVILPSFFYLLPIPLRLSYILSLCILYFCPAIILFSQLAQRFSPGKNFRNDLITLAFPATSVVFLAPTLRGYPDIGGLCLLIIALLYSLSLDMSHPLPYKKAMLMGILLWSPFVFRRWYAYTIISIYTSVPIFNYFLFKKYNISYKIFPYIRNIFIAGITSVSLVGIFQLGVFYKIFKYNLNTMYSAYKDPLIECIIYTIHSIGSIHVIIASIGIFILAGRVIFLKKISTTDAFFIFCLFNLILSFFLFTRTQMPGIQHVLPFGMWIIFMCCYSINMATKPIKWNYISYSLVYLFIVISLYEEYNSFVKEENYPSTLINNLLPQKTLPLHVENYKEYNKIVDFCKKVTQEGSSISILSSGFLFNEDTIDNMSHHQFSKYILDTTQVDLRDGINTEIFLAQYLIVADPVQTHLTHGQNVITIPATEILQHQGIGKAFIKLEQSYTLSHNVHAYIYQRTRNLSKEEINAYFEKFYKIYPQWRGKYNADLIYQNHQKRGSR